jgi:hypothetical protein
VQNFAHFHRKEIDMRDTMPGTLEGFCRALDNLLEGLDRRKRAERQQQRQEEAIAPDQPQRPSINGTGFVAGTIPADI